MSKGSTKQTNGHVQYGSSDDSLNLGHETRKQRQQRKKHPNISVTTSSKSTSTSNGARQNVKKKQEQKQNQDNSSFVGVETSFAISLPSVPLSRRQKKRANKKFGTPVNKDSTLRNASRNQTSLTSVSSSGSDIVQIKETRSSMSPSLSPTKRSMRQKEEPGCNDNTSNSPSPSKTRKVSLAARDQMRPIWSSPASSSPFNRASSPPSNVPSDPISSSPTGPQARMTRNKNEQEDHLHKQLTSLTSLSLSSLQKSKTERKSSPEVEKDVADGQKLCPFCDEILPQNPSEKLTRTLQRLKRNPHCRTRIDNENPDALKLPGFESFAYCRRHRWETTDIPFGIKQGYPDEIDWEILPERIEAKVLPSINKYLTMEAESKFFTYTKKLWLQNGARKMGNVLNEFDTFEDEIPGYYGPRGFETIYKVFNEYYKNPSKEFLNKLQPLDLAKYIRRVLIPETALLLIQQDMNCSKKQSLEILKQSRNFGIAMFRSEDDDDSVEDYPSNKEGEEGEEYEEDGQKHHDLFEYEFGESSE